MSVISPPAATSSPLRIAIYGDLGAESDKTLALYRALAAMGHQPMAVRTDDLTLGRLTTANFDVFVLPAGEGGSDTSYLQNIQAISGAEAAIRNFVSSGGGFIGIEAGARYAANNSVWNGVSQPRTLDLYAGNFYGPANQVGPGMGQITLTDPQFGPGIYTTYFSSGAGYFSLAAGATRVASFDLGAGSQNGRPAIVRFTYGSGRAVLVAPSLELEEDSELDWTTWDNLDAAHYDADSEWPLLAQLLEWIETGQVTNETVINPAPLTGGRFAVYATHTPEGGAYPGLLPAVGRVTEYSSHTPLAIRDTEVKNQALTRAHFDVIIFPGGYAPGYITQLTGHEQKIRDFVSASGGYVGISAGTFYAADDIGWYGQFYPYPLNLFLGEVMGPLDDIAPWPGWALTPLHINDPDFGDFTLDGLYWGEGYLELPPAGQQQVDTVATFAYGGQYAGLPGMVKHSYGSGRVIQPNMHLEVEEGSTNDWVYFDNFQYGSNDPQVDPESDWPFLSEVWNWARPLTPSLPFESGGINLAVQKGPTDTTGETLGASQRDDTAGASPTQVRLDDGWYSVSRGRRGDWTGFGQGLVADPANVVLQVHYSVQPGYNGSNALQWTTDGLTWRNTTIRPQNGQVDFTATFDLWAAGVDTAAELQALRLRFTNNSGPVAAVSLGYLWVIAP
ncbi:MAG: BPL-N domain-containing protein [Chloroflexota bacterium]